MLHFSGQLSYFMSICTYVFFSQVFIEIFFLFDLCYICEAAALKVASFYLGNVKSARALIREISIGYTDSLV